MGLVSVCAKVQLSSWSKSGWKVCGGGVEHVTNSNTSCFELSWVTLGFDNNFIWREGSLAPYFMSLLKLSSEGRG